VGSQWIFDHLGVRPQQGGEHPRMGTHNVLLRLGEAMYLEVIAINPSAPKPSRARWFALDALPTEAEPQLAGWVARTEDIRKSAVDASEMLGTVESMSRGSLEWLISIPEDGSLPLGGVAPMLIQWQTASHPALGMQDQGCELLALELLHPCPERISELLGSLAVAEPGVSVSVAVAAAPSLVAHVRTPLGMRSI
jgi:hypothetical protein